METIASNKIVYDNGCPLCNAYTGAFIKAGALAKDGRLAFSDADISVINLLDSKRARHEIPLLDTNTGTVRYGLDALIFIVAQRWPITAPLITKPFFKKLLQPLYKFISYNRRVIAGTPTPATGFDCSPDFNFLQRGILIALGMTFTLSAILGFAWLVHLPHAFILVVMVFLYFTLLMVTNVLFNGAPQKMWDYLGHLAVLGIIESTLFFISTWLIVTVQLPVMLFTAQGAIRVFALQIHARRVKNNGFSPLCNYAFATGAVIMIIYLALVL